LEKKKDQAGQKIYWISWNWKDFQVCSQ
jgi:hypothetical protein